MKNEKMSALERGMTWEGGNVGFDEYYRFFEPWGSSWRVFKEFLDKLALKQVKIYDFWG